MHKGAPPLIALELEAEEQSDAAKPPHAIRGALAGPMEQVGVFSATPCRIPAAPLPRKGMRLQPQVQMRSPDPTSTAVK